MDKITLKLTQLTKTNFVFSAILLCLVFSYIISYAMHLFNPETLDIDYLNNKSIPVKFILTVIVTPIIETLIYQYAIIEIVFRILKSNKTTIAILLSSVIFGLSHFYSITYITATFILGLLFSCVYVIARKRNDVNPYWLLTVIHGSINLMAFIVNDLLPDL